jgi:hypothetical protein
MDDKNKTASLYSKMKRWLGAAFQAVIHKPLLASVVILVIAGLLITGVIVALRDDSKPTYTTNKGADAGEENSTAGETPTNTGASKKSQSKPKSGATTPKQTDPCVADPDICNYAKTSYDYSKIAHIREETKKPNGRLDLKFTYQSTDGQGNTRSILYTPGHENETVAYDGFIYAKDESDGGWMKYNSNDPAAPTTYKPGPKSGTVDHTKYNYKKIGTAACGAAQCVTYSITPKTTSTWQTTLTFELETYRLHAYRIDDSSSFSDTTITYTSVTIAEPSPVKNP